jgi:hypothetical protein
MTDNHETHASDSHLLLANPWLYSPGDIFTFSGTVFKYYVWKHKDKPVYDEKELQSVPGTCLFYEFSYFREVQNLDFVLLKHKQSSALKSKLFLKCLNTGYKFSDHLICLKSEGATNTTHCSINGEPVIERRKRSIPIQANHFSAASVQVDFYTLLKKKPSRTKP